MAVRPILFTPRDKQVAILRNAVAGVREAASALNEQRGMLDALLFVAYPDFNHLSGHSFDLDTLEITGPAPEE